LGYVGLPLVLIMAKAGLKVIGVDIARARVREINEGKSFMADIPDTEIKSVQKSRVISTRLIIANDQYILSFKMLCHS